MNLKVETLKGIFNYEVERQGYPMDNPELVDWFTINDTGVVVTQYKESYNKIETWHPWQTVIKFEFGDK